MEKKVSSKILEYEISMKLCEYLKRKMVMDDRMYDYVINRLMKKQEGEKRKVNDVRNNQILA